MPTKNWHQVEHEMMSNRGATQIAHLNDHAVMAAAGTNLANHALEHATLGVATPSPLRNLVSQAVKTFIWHGDSTTELMTGNGLVPYVKAPYVMFNQIPGVVLNENHGSTGLSLAALLTAADTATNGGGVYYGIERTAAAAATSDLLIWSFGLNDFRQAATLTTVSGQVAAALAFQNNVKAYLARFRAIAPRVPILFRVPNTVAATSSYIVGPSGQNVTDAIRMAYLGDETQGVPAITTLDSNSVVLDVGRIVFGTTSWALANVPSHIAADGLHPSSSGFNQIARLICEFINQQASGLNWGMQAIGYGNIQTSASTYMDLQFSLPAASIFGNTSGTSYAALTSPVIGIGDQLRIVQPTGTKNRIKLTAIPYQNNGGSYVRWVNGPDGAFHTEIVATSAFAIQRPGILTLGEIFARRLSAAGIPKALYPYRVEAGGAGTVTIRGLPNAAALNLSTRAPTTADALSLSMIGGDNAPDSLGVSLSGATISGVDASNPGKFVLTGLSGNYTAAVGQFGHIVVG